MLLSTDVWVAALVRRAELTGGFAAIARKGDPRAGAVLVRVYNLSDRSTRLYSEAVRGDGERIWMQPAPGADEQALAAYVERSVRIDPDIWVVDVEDKQGRHFLTEDVEQG
jgi:hypothetical protein